jgi:hypothetical protein
MTNKSWEKIKLPSTPKMLYFFFKEKNHNLTVTMNSFFVFVWKMFSTIILATCFIVLFNIFKIHKAQI